MVIWSTLEASCPVCSQRTRLRQVGSGFVTGQDSDLFLRMQGRHIIQAEIHTCLRCHYSGYDEDFLRDLPPGLREKFLREVSHQLREEKVPGGDGRPPFHRTPLPDVQYYWAARSAEAMGGAALTQGKRWLRAYWCLRIAPSAHLPQAVKEVRKQTYLTQAIARLRSGLRRPSDPNLIYLVGELCRRQGEYRVAETLFRRFLECKTGARYLRHAAAKLIPATRDQIGSEMSMEQILFDGASGGGSRDRGKPDLGSPEGGLPGNPDEA